MLGEPGVKLGLTSVICHATGPYTLNRVNPIHLFNLFYEYSNLAYVRVPVIDRVHQAESVIRFVVVASRAYVNTYEQALVCRSNRKNRREQTLTICLQHGE